MFQPVLAPPRCFLPLCWFPGPAQCLHILVPPPSFSEFSQVKPLACFISSVYLSSKLPDKSIHWLQNICALGVSLSLFITLIHVGHHVHITRVMVYMPFPFLLCPDCECSESEVIFQSSLWSESPAQSRPHWKSQWIFSKYPVRWLIGLLTHSPTWKENSKEPSYKLKAFICLAMFFVVVV